MQGIPLSAVPSQNLAVTLGSQAVQLSLYQRGFKAAANMYLDLICNGAQILTGRLVRAYGGLPQTRAAFMLVGRHYLPFLGDLLFVDTQATDTNPTLDPQPSGLGTRWQLLYYAPGDITVSA
jgi:hypothetical protein